MSEAVFQKHTYGKESKRTYDSLEDFDPRPLEYRGTASTNLLQLLNDVRGQGLCLSLLFDPAMMKLGNWNGRQENKEILQNGLLLDDFELQLLYLVILFIEDQKLPLIIW